MKYLTFSNVCELFTLNKRTSGKTIELVGDVVDYLLINPNAKNVLIITYNYPACDAVLSLVSKELKDNKEVELITHVTKSQISFVCQVGSRKTINVIPYELTKNHPSILRGQSFDEIYFDLDFSTILKGLDLERLYVMMAASVLKK